MAAGGSLEGVERRGLMFVLSSPSGAGKSTLSRLLIERMPGLSMSVSATTRSMRPGEVDGQHYHFIDKARFDAMVKNGEFLEYAPVCFISALTHRGLAELFDEVDRVALEARKRIEAGALLTTLRQALERRPMSSRGVALRIYSAQQVAVSPPTIAVRVNLPDAIHFSYRRYLLNSLRRAFAFTGSPIRLLLRKGGGKRPAEPTRPQRRASN